MGAAMYIRLKNRVTLTGKIEKIVPGQNVTLRQVWIEGKDYRDTLIIPSADIEDLNVHDQQPVTPVAPVNPPPPRLLPHQHAPAHAYQSLNPPLPTAVPIQYPTQHFTQPQTAPYSPITHGPYPPVPKAQGPSAPKQPKQPFVDPAIVSMSNPPMRPSPVATNLPSSVAASSPQTAQLPFSASTLNRPLSKASNRTVTTQSPIPKITVGSSALQDTPTKSGLVESMDGLDVEDDLADDLVDDAAAALAPAAPEKESQATQKKGRKRNRQSKKNAPEAVDVEASPSRGSRAGKKGKGWRETPMLEDTSSFQPYKALRKTKANHAVNDNGWASEDVTDVQELGEFDFEGGLKKFDKRTVFDELKEKDQIEEADRLVSHNRARSKPGTAGGKNLHYTENVLDIPTTIERPNKATPDDFWKSEADDGARNGSERLSGRELGSRQGSRRGEAKRDGTKRSQSRKASAANVGQAPSRINSGVSNHKAAKRQRKAKNANGDEKLLTNAASSAGFYVPPSNRKIEILSPLQMLNLENIAQNDLGLTEDMMTENAARGIAEVALHVLTDPAIKVRLAAADGDAPNSPPTVVVLAGNNKSGYRSIAAGRHLRCKGISVIVCVVGLEKGERDLSVDMTKQLRLFKNFGGKVCTKSELFEFVRKASIPVISMDAPRSVLPHTPPMAVTLIIDALLGHVTPFEDLRASDQATVYELIEWTNRNEAFVLAVDVPTGIDHTTGMPTVQDGHSLYIRPRYVVSIGAPKKGLFEAIAMADIEDDETVTGRISDDTVLDWSLFLVDIGLGASVWKRAGTKIRRGIDFGNKWALQIKYQSGADQAEE